MITFFFRAGENHTHPMRDGVIHEKFPQHRDRQESGERNALGIATGHEKGRNDCKHHHKRRIACLGDLHSVKAPSVRNVVKHDVGKVPNESAAVCAVAERKPEDQPHYGKNRETHEYLRHEGHGVLHANQPRLKQSESWGGKRKGVVGGGRRRGGEGGGMSGQSVRKKWAEWKAMPGDIPSTKMVDRRIQVCPWGKPSAVAQPLVTFVDICKDCTKVVVRILCYATIFSESKRC